MTVNEEQNELVPVNYVTARNGKVAAICEVCGKKSKYTQAEYNGEPSFFNLSKWSQAPFPKNFIHRDGSIGSLYKCPTCENRLRNGESLKCRSYLEVSNND